MKTEQNNEMSRRSFLKQTVLAGTAICVTPTLEKVTAAERAIAGKSSTSVTTFPASMAAVRMQRTLGSIYCIRNGIWLHGTEPQPQPISK